MPIVSDRPSSPGCRFSPPRPDGTVLCFDPEIDNAGGLDIALWAKYPNHDAWIELGSWSYTASEGGMIVDIIKGVGKWDTASPDTTGVTWAEIYAGATYTSPRTGEFYSGYPGMEIKFVDWLATQQTWMAEVGAELWFQNVIMPWLQSCIDATVNVLPAPPPPPSPAPKDVTWPPFAKFFVQNAEALALAEMSRVTLGVDPHTGNFTVASLPITKPT